MVLGAQLYTVRDFCKTKEDLSETLKKVADIGYTSVQLSGVCGYEAEWMKEELKKDGLTADLTHFSYDRIVKETEDTIRFHKTFGCNYIGIGGNPKFNFEYSGMKTFIEEVRPAVKKIAQAGMKFMYHNHHMEFGRFPEAGGKNTIELLCDAFGPDELGFTLDCYWVVEAGADPVQLFKQLKGRLDCVHFKDKTFSLEAKGTRMAPVGKGNINHPALVEAAQEAGTKYVFVEQDSCYEEDPFDCLKQSYEYLKSLGLK